MLKPLQLVLIQDLYQNTHLSTKDIAVAVGCSKTAVVKRTRQLQRSPNFSAVQHDKREEAKDKDRAAKRVGNMTQEAHAKENARKRVSRDRMRAAQGKPKLLRVRDMSSEQLAERTERTRRMQRAWELANKDKKAKTAKAWRKKVGGNCGFYGLNNGMPRGRRLTELQKSEIREDIQSGRTWFEVCRKFNVTPPTLHRLVMSPERLAEQRAREAQWQRAKAAKRKHARENEATQ